LTDDDIGAELEAWRAEVVVRRHRGADAGGRRPRLHKKAVKSVVKLRMQTVEQEPAQRKYEDGFDNYWALGMLAGTPSGDAARAAHARA